MKSVDNRLSSSIEEGFRLGFSGFSGEARIQFFHRHMEVEVLTVSKGEILYNIGEQSFKLSAGDWAIFWGIHMHGASSGEDKSICHAIRVPLRWFIDFDLPSHFLIPILQGHLFIPESPETNLYSDMIVHWAEILRHHPERSTKIVYPAIDSFYNDIAYHYSGDDQFHIKPTTSNKFLKITNMVLKEYLAPISIDDIADYVGVHRDTATRIFKSVTNMGLKEFITYNRLEHARVLLLKSKLSIKKISEECGFPTTSNFFLAYKKFYHTSPGDYRKASKRMSINEL